jgi:hypothetical protein
MSSSYKFSWEYKSAPLSGDFGRDYACRVFGLSVDDLEKLVGRFTRGARKGMLRGAIAWGKITRGGWVKTGPYDFDTNTPCGFVASPGVKFGHGLFDRDGRLVHGVDLDGSDSVGALVSAACGKRYRDARDEAPAPAPTPARAGPFGKLLDPSDFGVGGLLTAAALRAYRAAARDAARDVYDGRALLVSAWSFLDAVVRLDPDGGEMIVEAFVAATQDRAELDARLGDIPGIELGPEQAAQPADERSAPDVDRR